MIIVIVVVNEVVSYWSGVKIGKKWSSYKHSKLGQKWRPGLFLAENWLFCPYFLRYGLKIGFALNLH